MSKKWTIKSLIPVLALLVALPLLGAGCQGGEKPFAPSPATQELSSTLVPNVPMDMYVYGKQESPTKIPMKMGGKEGYVEVDSLAIWGIPSGTDFAFGMGLTLKSAKEASYVSEQIAAGKELWKKLSENLVYLVYGTGPAAESLKNTILANNFKKYDNEKTLKALATMPTKGATKLAAVVLAEPTDALLGLATKNVKAESLSILSTMVKLGKFEVVAAGLYSPSQIDLVKMMDSMKNQRDMLNLDVGLMVMLKSGLPGLVVEPAVKKFLTEYKFAETKLGDLTIYKGSWDAGNGVTIPVLVRIEGNYVYGAVSGKESYSQTLLTSITK